MFVFTKGIIKAFACFGKFTVFKLIDKLFVVFFNLASDVAYLFALYYTHYLRFSKKIFFYKRFFLITALNDEDIAAIAGIAFKYLGGDLMESKGRFFGR